MESAPSRYPRLAPLLLAVAVIALLISMPLLPGLFRESEYYGLKRSEDVSALSMPETEQPFFSILFMGYLQCGTVCPEQLLNLKLLSERLKNTPVRFVFLSLDPERDSAAKLNNVMQALGERFVALRPESNVLAQKQALLLADSAALRPVKNGYEIDHSGFLYVVNPAQQLELVYTTSDLDLARVEQDLRYLIDQFDDRK